MKTLDEILDDVQAYLEGVELPTYAKAVAEARATLKMLPKAKNGGAILPNAVYLVQGDPLQGGFDDGMKEPTPLKCTGVADNHAWFELTCGDQLPWDADCVLSRVELAPATPTLAQSAACLHEKYGDALAKMGDDEKVTRTITTTYTRKDRP